MINELSQNLKKIFFSEHLINNLSAFFFFGVAFSARFRTELDHSLSKDDQNVVLFHSTDHQSACDIFCCGIDLCQGRQKRYFSCVSEFYLTDNSEEALNWAKNTTARPALLVCQINRQEHLNDVKKLNLFENDQKWPEIVS